MKKLKKEIIVQEIFTILNQKCLESSLSDTDNVYLSFETIINHLHAKYNIDYRSEVHLYHQLKNYEKQNSLYLFSRKNDHGIIVLLSKYNTFKKRLYLNKNLKILLANGCFDIITQLYKTKNDLHIYLGTGTECYYVAKILFEKKDMPIHIYTQNLGIIQLYCESDYQLDNITVHTKNSTIDKKTFTLIDEKEDYFLSINFDAIIQSPTYIINNTGYVVSELERNIKKNVIENSKGKKIILLTLFEFLIPSTPEKNKLHAFCDILEYDYAITPPKKMNQQIYELYLKHLPFEEFISYFSYTIYKIKK